MSSSEDAKNANRLRTLQAEIDCAAAMMALARLSRDPNDVRRYQESGVKSYLTALSLIVGTSMSEQRERAAWNDLAPIRNWLENARLLPQR
jgi:hypothetical protein